MPAKKKPKIRGLEQALEKIPEEDRGPLGDASKEAFEDFDPASPPGQPVRPLGESVKNCLDCGALLPKKGFTLQLPRDKAMGSVSGKPMTMLECPKCDAIFMKEAKS